MRSIKRGKNRTFYNIKRTIKYIKKQKFNLFIYFFFSLLSCAISIVSPLLGAKIIIYLTNNELNQLILTALFLFAVEVFRNAVTYIIRTYGNKVFFNTVSEIQYNLIDEVLKLQTTVIDKTSSGVFVERITQDPNDIAETFTSIVSTFISILTSVGIFVAIFIVNKIMFAFFVFFLFVKYFIEKIRIKKWFEHDEERRKINESKTGLITEFVRGSKDIKSLYIGTSFLNKIKLKIDESTNRRLCMSQESMKYSTIAGNVSDLKDLLFILLSVYLIKINMLTIPNAIVINSYKYETEQFLYWFTELVELIKRFNVSCDRIFEIIDSRKFKKEKFGKIHLDKVDGNFEFKNVSFSYNKKIKVLDKISFKIHPNETIAFVGKSGAGKTTLFNLLYKLYDIDSGKILIEKKDINDLDEESIRENMSIITQNPYIFNFSIKENLKIVKPNASMKEIKEACKLACLDTFIEKLPDKYNTVIGEGGVLLSGGQKQRLAIARALLRKTEIILLDEATSSLDNETQSKIQKAIKNLKGEYTVLIIAHRLSTVESADKIIVLDGGKIVSVGTKEELLKKCDLFKELYMNEMVD